MLIILLVFSSTTVTAMVFILPRRIVLVHAEELARNVSQIPLRAVLLDVQTRARVRIAARQRAMMVVADIIVAKAFVTL